MSRHFPFKPAPATTKAGTLPGRPLLRPVLRCASLLSLIIATTANAQVSHSDTSRPMAAVFWQGAMTAARVDYEAKVVEMALERTRAEYGDYTYEINTHAVTNMRLERDIREGRVVNIVSSPTWQTDKTEDSVLRAIPLPIVQGLLGYRQCVVRKADLERFASVRTIEDLRPLTAGLGSDWIDVDIFDHSGMQWFGGKNVEQLYSMLARGRLDYLPLSSIEIETSLRNSAVRDELAVAPGFMIYYPLPVFVQVSTSQPLLAERIEHGLRKILEDGSLHALFEEHYGAIVTDLKSRQVRVIALENPFLPDFVEPSGPTLLSVER